MRISGTALLLLFSTPNLTTATPFTWGDNVVKPLSFPPGTKITIYIQPDPKGLGRDGLIADGVNRWSDSLNAHNITLDVKIQAPPATQPDNSMTYKFVADGTSLAGDEVGPGKNDGVGAASGNGSKLVSGQSIVRDALPAGTDDEKNFLRNLGQHEMTHMLGLDDDDKGEVTNHLQSSAARTKADYNDRDKAELNQLYAASNTGGAQHPTGTATPAGGGAAAGYYDYAFLFQGAGDPLSDPQHIALINLGINPAYVTSLDLPPGWIAYLRNGVVDPSDPYFDGIFQDGAPNISPFDPLTPINYIPIRNTDPAQALSITNASMNLRVHTTGPIMDGTISVYAGGALQQLFGPVAIPEPASFGTAASGLLLLAFRTAIRFRQKGASARRPGAKACAKLLVRELDAHSGG